MKTISFIKGLLLLGLLFANTFVFAQIHPLEHLDYDNRDIVLPDNMDTANCVFFPEGVEWGVRVGWSSGSIASNFNIPLVGDLDDDGNPEIICCSKNGDIHEIPYRYNTEILVFDGVTKQLKTTISLQSKITASDGASYGLIKLPNRKGLIVVACFDNKLRAYDITSSYPSTPYWVSDVEFGSNFGDWAVNVSFADFNVDGHPEVYIRDKIYNAETGVLLAQADGSNTGSSYAHWSHLVHYKLSSPFAANVLGDDNLELILGNKVYKVNLVNLNGQTSNSVTLAKSLVPPTGVPEDGHTQVADFNLDGYLDVFISVRDTDVHSGTVYGYVWDIHNNTVSSPFVINTSFSGKSYPMIDDIDNDGLLEILIQCGVSGSNQKFHAYKYQPDSKTFTFLWGYVTDEDSFSNGITSFDFNQDGLLELVICDQSTLKIINGSGKSHITQNDTIPVYVISSFPFSEITIMQYPIIVDADDDGHAEIVSVGSDKLNILESSGAEWAPARKVWNQYAYNVTNVHNDLTVTRYLFNNSTAFTDPDGVVRRPFNNFLQQVTTLDQYGRPYIAATDAAVLSTNIITGSGIATLEVTYTNQGDYTLKAPYSITIFANHEDGEVVQTITINTPLLVGETKQQTISLPVSNPCQLPDVSSLVVVINCAGGGIAQYGNQQPECDITNNTKQIFIDSLSETYYISELACDKYEWNGVTYSESGEYQQSFISSNGCDSTVVLNLAMITDCSIHGKVSIYPWTDITAGVYSYYIDSVGVNPAAVHWSIDRNDWRIVPHGTSCELICMSEGSGVLRAWTEGESCDIDTTLVLNAAFFDTEENEAQSLFVYPNPTNGSVTVEWEDIVAVKLYNMYGQLVKEYRYAGQDKCLLNFDDNTNGMYILEITTSNRTVYRPLVLTK